ncbi:DUF938 domain-containing protein [Qipengyuania sp. XHP0207]|uniref:DUF938 domain-containing protein n=1 Tax=Qipengyuania sp. XHP0207 TaxID=3038078 RepID=UPI00241BEF2E|nr:DUF938 domain-containing protein [Qipengyuania sp. XHP0207]MDG5748838.1 DUF938 domain-containing protein [Qipengyuania sp. XHP0207]
MKRHAPATARNVRPIGDVLEQELPEKGMVLEIASGTGEHAVAFAARFPALEWQPSDPDEEARASIQAWRAEAGLASLRAPVALDARAPDWPVTRADAVVCINMAHISPWSATVGLFEGAAQILGAGAPLILYGPFLEDEVETTRSNRAFDADLRFRNAEWGLRERSQVDRIAGEANFAPSRRYAMPANNLSLVYRRN